MASDALVRRENGGWLRRRYRQSALARVLDRAGERLMRAHIEFNFASAAPHIPRGARLLDVGAWDCRLSALYRDRLVCDVTAVDVVDKNVTDVPLVRYDGRALPFEDGAFDVVTIMYVLHHSADDAAILAEARRVCAPGGRVIVGEDQVETRWERTVAVGFHVWLLSVTLMGWKGQFRRIEEWRERFARAGLAVAQVDRLGPHLGKRLWPRNVLFVLEP